MNAECAAEIAENAENIMSADDPFPPVDRSPVGAGKTGGYNACPNRRVLRARKEGSLSRLLKRVAVTMPPRGIGPTAGRPLAD
jgi:hypothetical protein